MYAETGGPNEKWGSPISNGGAGHHWPPAGDGPGFDFAYFKCKTNPIVVQIIFGTQFGFLQTINDTSENINSLPHFSILKY